MANVKNTMPAAAEQIMAKIKVGANLGVKRSLITIRNKVLPKVPIKSSRLIGSLGGAYVSPVGVAGDSVNFIRQDNYSVTGALGTNVPYARIQELGGTIRPKSKKWLHWVDELGVDHFAKEVHIPAKHYFFNGLLEAAPSIIPTIATALKQALNGTNAGTN